MNEYETVANGNEHETRNRHVAMNEYETVTNGSENEARDRHVAMNGCGRGQVTVEG